MMQMGMEPQQEMLMKFEPDLWLKVAAAAAAGFWGGLQFLAQTLIVLMIADIITGILASLASGKRLSSDVSFRGLAKKTMMLLSVGLAAWLEPLAGGAQLQNAVAGFWCANELLSIVENYGTANLPVPDALRGMIEKLYPKPHAQEG